MPQQRFQFLFYILQSEQSILSRTDQKAYTLLSVLGVFMVFFIVYYRMMAINWFIVIVLAIYFGAALLTIWSMVRTILPRYKQGSTTRADHYHQDPTFFGGIREFASSEDYYTHLQTLEEDQDYLLRLLSRQVYALATINWKKNSHLRRGVYFFVLAIGAELLMILSTFVKMGLESLAH